MYFYGSNAGPPGGHFAPWDLIVKDYLAMLHTKFQAPESSGSEKEILNISLSLSLYIYIYRERELSVFAHLNK